MRKNCATVLKTEWTKVLCAGLSLFAGQAVMAKPMVTVDKVKAGLQASEVVCKAGAAR